MAKDLSPKATRIRALRKDVKKSDRYKNLKQVIKSDSYSIAFESLKNELRVNHSSRKLSSLSPSNPNFGKKLVEASMVEVSIRSRAVEMKVLATDVSRYLERSLKYFGDYVTTEFSDGLSVFSTIKERTQFIARLLEPFYKHLDKLQTFIEIVDMYISDIDKASYAAKNIVSTFEVIRRNEGSTHL